MLTTPARPVAPPGCTSWDCCCTRWSSHHPIWHTTWWDMRPGNHLVKQTYRIQVCTIHFAVVLTPLQPLAKGQHSLIPFGLAQGKCNSKAQEPFFCNLLIKSHVKKNPLKISWFHEDWKAFDITFNNYSWCQTATKEAFACKKHLPTIRIDLEGQFMICHGTFPQETKT